jgi:hypothetical protein
VTETCSLRHRPPVVQVIDITQVVFRRKINIWFTKIDEYVLIVSKSGKNISHLLSDMYVFMLTSRKFLADYMSDKKYIEQKL